MGTIQSDFQNANEVVAGDPQLQLAAQANFKNKGSQQNIDIKDKGSSSM
jgi:hypothetical protein